MGRDPPTDKGHPPVRRVVLGPDRPDGVTALRKKPFSIADLLEEVRRLSTGGPDDTPVPMGGALP